LASAAQKYPCFVRPRPGSSTGTTVSSAKGLTLSEAKQILARLQQAVVSVQAEDHAVLRPDCSACGQACHVMDWRLRRVATLFGTVPVRL
jgi:hypothetical protein